MFIRWQKSTRQPGNLPLCNLLSKGYYVFALWGPSILTWELRTGNCNITLEDKQKIGNLTYYISSKSLRDAESE